MFRSRPSAWTVIGVLVLALMASILPAAASAKTPPALAIPTVADPNVVCTHPGNLAGAPDMRPTRWLDEFHPPNTIRILRSKGPNAGRVETVDFWKYVGVVVRAEYSSGQDKPDPWMRMGALTVKQYAWYKAMWWGGGRVTYTDPTFGTVTSCWDVKDTTADQIYKDVKPDPLNPGQWIPANVPTSANLKAMRDTWHVSLRKWMPDKLKSRLFLTGYRSGKQKPCGNDSTGFKIFQKSLRDCGVKSMRFEETIRRYFEPKLEIVNTRESDVLGDAGSWRGDFGVVSPNGAWRMFRGTQTGFVEGDNGTFSGTVLGEGVGETTGASNSDNTQTPQAGDPRLFADVVLLVEESGTKKVRVMPSNGTNFDAPVTTTAPSDSQRLLVGDFNGDWLADAGLLSATSGTDARLVVMPSIGNGNFGSAVDWWSGPLNLSAADLFVAAGDVNGDGKADLVMRDSDAGYRVAKSPASCSTFGNWGACNTPGGNGLGSATDWQSAPGWTLADGRATLTDYDRDGRDDLLVVTANGSGGIKLMAMRATDGAFASPVQLWSGAGSVSNTVPHGMQVDPDGLGDVALLTADGSDTDVTWLRSVEKGAAPATMVVAGGSLDTAFTWGGVRPF